MWTTWERRHPCRRGQCTRDSPARMPALPGIAGYPAFGLRRLLWRDSDGFLLFGGRLGRQRAAGVEFLFEIVQFFAQFAVGFLQIQHFLAEVLEIIHRLAPRAELGHGPLGDAAFGAVFGSGGKFVEDRDGFRIAERAQSREARPLDAALLVVNVMDKE